MGFDFLEEYEKNKAAKDSLIAIKDQSYQDAIDAISKVTRVEEHGDWMAESTNVDPSLFPIIESVGETLKSQAVSATEEARTANITFTKKYDQMKNDIEAYHNIKNQYDKVTNKLELASKIAHPTMAEYMFGSNVPENEENYNMLKKEAKNLRMEMISLEKAWFEKPYAGGREGMTGSYPGGSNVTGFKSAPVDRRTEYQRLEDLHENALAQAKHADELKQEYISSYSIPGFENQSNINKEEDLLFEYDEVLDETIFKANTRF